VATELTVLFALDREAAPFRRLHRGQTPVVVSGVGATAAQAAAERICGNNPPRLVIAAGFAGGLHPSWPVASVLLADEVVDETGRAWPLWTCPVEGARPGRLLTATRLLTQPHEKRRWAEQSGAVAVDMESAAIAAVCQRYGVACACVRAISDDVETPLSDDLVPVIAGGTVRWSALVSLLLRRPERVRELLRLARGTSQAAQSLAGVLQAISVSENRFGADRT
jgi:adenosylhomocysteine nucleosidase